MIEKNKEFEEKRINRKAHSESREEVKNLW